MLKSMTALHLGGIRSTIGTGYDKLDHIFPFEPNPKSIHNVYSAYKPFNGKWQAIRQGRGSAGLFFGKIDSMQS